MGSPPAAVDEVFETADYRIRVVGLAEGLANPWSLAFLPNGDMLVTEKPGRLRLIRDGVLMPNPVPGVPEVDPRRQGGLMDVVLHPQFAENSWVYLTYSKPDEGDNDNATTALARGSFDGSRFTDVEDLFVANAWAETGGHYGSRLAFTPDGKLFMSIGERQQRDRAQDTTDHAGTVLRLNDDGSVPDDNPFIGRAGFLPEIYSYGHRSPQGLTVHPETGEVWENEHGPRGGDEANLILPGRNYGWPIVSYGREYSGEIITNQPWKEGLEPPKYYWVPSIAISGMTFYTGDRFPEWKGNLFVGGLRHYVVQRVAPLNQRGGFEREPLLTELRLRIRDVRQGPDGLLYVVADGDLTRRGATGAVLRIEPVD
jgi:glucose/arabinose dehydrogenase